MHLHALKTPLNNTVIFASNYHVYFNKVKGRNGEGNGAPLQYSCLENPMDGGA